MTEQTGCRPRLVSDRADEPYSSWVRRARCAGQTAVFGDQGHNDDALAVCGGCVVRRQCRAWALANAVEGVAGGMTEDERRRGAGRPASQSRSRRSRTSSAPTS